MSAPSQIGPYAVERELGRGGMGVVYLARDPRLDRRAAIKALPVEFAQDPERLARFEREARLLASLTHPNIAAVYGLEEKDGARYLVMEFVEGRTLAEALALGPLPVDEALQVGVQIAAGVEAAHEAGVIHRDLKPGNVIVTASGKAKVLDFGLAKAVAPGVASSSSLVGTASLAHRATLRATGAGNVVGTPGYLSPEQARGKPLDRRTDVWSFGCVLYECLAGRQLYSGETVSDVIAAILEREPDWSKLPERTPGRVRELLSMCLEKDQSKRLRDMGDVRLELERAIAGREWSASSLAMRPGRARRAGWAGWARGAAVLLVGAAIGAGVWALIAGRGDRTVGRAPAAVVRGSVEFPEAMIPGSFGISNDGSTLMCRVRLEATAGGRNSQVFVRPFASEEARGLPGTERATAYLGASFDGKWIGFLVNAGALSSLMRVPADGSGPAMKICDFDRSAGGSVHWMRNGDVLVQMQQTGPYLRYLADGTTRGPGVVAILDGACDTVRPGWALPDGERVVVAMGTYTARGWREDIGIMDLTSGRVKRLTEGGGGMVTPTGHFVFARGDRLMAAPFDAERLVFTSEPVAVLEGLQAGDDWGDAWFDLSEQTGTLVFQPGGLRGAHRRLGILDPAGKLEPWGDEERTFREELLSVSPDGRRFAVGISRSDGLFEVWVSEVDRPALRRLASSPTADCDGAVISADGKRVAYVTVTSGLKAAMWVVPFEGGVEPRRILEFDGAADEFFVPSAWTPNGQEVIFTRHKGGEEQVCAVAAEPDAQGVFATRPLLTGAAKFSEASFSADGGLLAYLSNEAGRRDAYVRAYGTDGTLGSPVRVPMQGASEVRWAPDERAIYVRDSGSIRVSRAAVSAEPELTVSKPAEVLDMERLGVAAGAALPGKRVLVIVRGPEERPSGKVNFVLNWYEELKAKVPIPAAGNGAK